MLMLSAGDLYIQLRNLKDSSTELKTLSKFITNDFYRDEILRIAKNLEETRLMLEKNAGDFNV